MTPEEIRAAAREFEQRLRQQMAGFPVIGDPRWFDPQRTLDEAAEAARRGGLPVVRARFEGDCIVFELARPRGEG